MTASTRLTWEDPPPYDDPQSPTANVAAVALAMMRRPGKWAIVAYCDRASRSAVIAERINTGREYGSDYEAIARQVGNQHRVYARFTADQSD